jgi:2-dehydropantoate 2-reductase
MSNAASKAPARFGAHKISMLQNLERGRPMEIDPLVTVVQEMGRLTKIPTPSIDAVLALVAQRARIAVYSPACRSGRPRRKSRFLHDRVALMAR